MKQVVQVDLTWLGGRFEPDVQTVIDATRRVLAGADAGGLLDALVFGAGNEVIRETCVAGRWREPGQRSGN